MSKFFAIVMCLIAADLGFGGNVVMAQEPEANEQAEVDPRIAEANARKAISDAETAASNAAAAASNARAAEIAAERAALLAAFPTSDTKGADGTASAEEGGYYATHLAHQAMEAAAEKVASGIKDANGITGYQVFLVNGLELPAAIAQWRQINSRIENLDIAITALLASLEPGQQTLSFEEKEGIGAATLLTAAPQILGGLADIASFFRSDIKAEGLSVTATDEDFTAMVLGKLRPTVPVRYPAVSLQGDTGLTERLSRLASLDGRLRERKAAIVRAGQRTLEQQKALLVPIVAEIARIDELLKNEKDEAVRAGLQQDKAIQESQKAGINQRIAFLESLTAGQGTAVDTLREDVRSLRA
jgi:hypothetical protein